MGVISGSSDILNLGMTHTQMGDSVIWNHWDGGSYKGKGAKTCFFDGLESLATKPNPW